MSPKRVIISADDFGLSEAVNEAVERAHRDGILSTASLMVAGAAAGDAVRRARQMPDLRVGLHLVVIEGDAMLPGAVPHLVDGAGRFPSNQLGLALEYFFRSRSRRQIAAEIASQYRAFAATGLPLDHANAHKHMHLHPTIGRMLIEAGIPHGLRAVRVPAEPPGVMRACGVEQGLGARALYRWSDVFRTQARRAGLRTNDHAFGIAWSGHMTAPRLATLAAHLPDGLSEIYFHPAARRDERITALMPDYEHVTELHTLLDPETAASLRAAGAELTTYLAT